jgi:hypothetical protein
MHVAAARLSARQQRLFLAALAASLLASFLAVAFVLTLRRLAGALVQPLGSFGLVSAGAICAAVTAVLRGLPLELSRHGPGTRYSVLRTQYWSSPASACQPGSTFDGLAFAIPGFASLLLLASLSLRGSPLGGLLAAWLLVIAAEAASWFTFYRQFPAHEQSALLRGKPVKVTEQPFLNDEREETVLPGLIQQMTRVREDQGESLHALIAAEIPGGDNLAVIHLAFCPPLASTPSLTAHALEVSDATIRITQAETFGTRIEVRVPKTVNEPRSVLVEVLGSVKDRQSA